MITPTLIQINDAMISLYGKSIVEVLVILAPLLKNNTIQSNSSSSIDISNSLSNWIDNNPPSISTIPTTTFIERFTGPEQLAIVSNSNTLVWWINLLNSNTINLLNSQLMSNLNQAVTYGVLQPQRVLEILNF